MKSEYVIGVCSLVFFIATAITAFHIKDDAVFWTLMLFYFHTMCASTYNAKVNKDKE